MQMNQHKKLKMIVLRFIVKFQLQVQVNTTRIHKRVFPNEPPLFKLSRKLNWSTFKWVKSLPVPLLFRQIHKRKKKKKRHPVSFCRNSCIWIVILINLWKNCTTMNRHRNLSNAFLVYRRELYLSQTWHRKVFLKWGLFCHVLQQWQWNMIKSGWSSVKSYTTCLV